MLTEMKGTGKRGIAVATVYLNGAFVEEEKAVISPEDRGFNFADGLYEVMRIYNGVPFCFEDHMRRLYSGAEELEIPMPLSEDEMQEVLLKLLEANDMQEASIYLQVTRGMSRRSHPFPDECEPTVFMKAREITRRWDRMSGRTAITQPDNRGGLCYLKTVGILANCMAQTRARRQGADTAIFVRNGFVTEGATASAFCVLDGVIHTHPLVNILPSVTRGNIVRLARDNGLPLVEQAVQADRFLSADEVIIGATVLEVAPVVQIDGRRIGDGEPGPVFRRLHEAFADLVERKCGTRS